MNPLKNIQYIEKLHDARWEKRRQQIFIRDRFRCLNCGSTDNLQVHHRQYHYVSKKEMYVDPWEYPDELLVTLCEKCHTKGHELYLVPVKLIAL